MKTIEKQVSKAMESNSRFIVFTDNIGYVKHKDVSELLSPTSQLNNAIVEVLIDPEYEGTDLDHECLNTQLDLVEQLIDKGVTLVLPEINSCDGNVVCRTISHMLSDAGYEWITNNIRLSRSVWMLNSKV